MFEAKFNSKCEGCGSKIEEGELIGYTEEFVKPVCRDCFIDPDRAVLVVEKTPPCTECWMVHKGDCL